MCYWPSVKSRWLDIGQVLFCTFMDQDGVELAPRAGKMNPILRYDWLPERAGWSYLARSGLPAVSRKKNFPESHIINPLLTTFVRSRWLDIGLALFFGEFMDLDSVSVHKHAKKETWRLSSHPDLTLGIWLWENFSCETRRVIPRGQLG